MKSFKTHNGPFRIAAVLTAILLFFNVFAPMALAAPPDKPSGGPGDGSGGSANTQTYDYSGAYSGVLVADGQTKSDSGATYTSTASDQNVALIQNGGVLTVSGDTFTKSGSGSSDDNCNFYGTNSILLAVGSSSKATVSDTTMTASGNGSNGIFATDNATVYANDVNISTTAANSRGLDATYGGTVVANNMTIDTKGDHCAATANDRGGGNVSVTNSTFTTAGSGSPLAYSTGTIELDNVTGTASGSQIAGMEGLNAIRIANSNLTSTLTGKTGSDPIANGVIIYQSTSGDADTSSSDIAQFEVSDSTLTSAIESGAMFYVTNTQGNIVLNNTTLDFDSDQADLIRVAGNDSNNWGSAGSNGGTVTMTGIGQTLKGDIVVDTISTLNLFLLDGTTYTGAADIETNSAGSTSSAPLTVNVDGTSKWIVTEDTTVTNLNVASGGSVVDESGKTATIKKGSTTLVQGTGDVTVTVTGSYGTTVTTTSANALTDSTIDRTGFDNAFGTSTAFGTNGSGSGQQETDPDDTDQTDDDTTDTTVPKIYYRGHVENIGWQTYNNGQSTWLDAGGSDTIGTTGQSLRVEALEIAVPQDYALTGTAHVQNIGDMTFSKTRTETLTDASGNAATYDVYFLGTTGKGLRMEGMTINMTKGGQAVDFDFTYRTHVQNVGWQDYVGNGGFAGTRGRGLRLEALQIKMSN